MTVAKSWRSPSAEYHNYMTNILFPVFSNTFMSLSERENSTKDFGTFLNTFTEFSNTVLQEVGPLTFSGFLESGLTSPFTTGLVIEVSYDDHNDDFNKLKTFFYDENFELVSKICTQYGFSIDKNAPWRFVADIGSEAMQEYIFGLPLSGIEPLDVNDLTDCEEPIVNDDINQRNEPSAYSQVVGLESVLRHSPGYRPYRAAETSVYSRQPYETVFAAAYRDPYELDIPFLQVYLLDFYNRHILKKPYYEETPQNTRVCNPSQTVLIERDEASPSVYEVFSRKWALKTYYMLRCEEKKLHKSTKEKTKDFRNYFYPKGDFKLIEREYRRKSLAPEEKVDRSIIDKITDYFSETITPQGETIKTAQAERIQTPPLPPTSMPAPNLMAQSPQKINGLTRSEQALLSPSDKIIAART